MCDNVASMDMIEEASQPAAHLLTDWKADVAATLATPLTTADRCDRCGARAYLRARLASGGVLLFCAHHGRAHRDKLTNIAVEIYDETDQLGAETGRA